MGFSPGDHVLVEAESTDRAARRGVVEEVVRDEPHPRYRMQRSVRSALSGLREVPFRFSSSGSQIVLMEQQW
jgi:hypothetical protein